MKASDYTERFGIVKYTVRGDKLTYKVSYPAAGAEKAESYKHTVDLRTGIETVEKLSKVYKEGYLNR